MTENLASGNNNNLFSIDPSVFHGMTRPSVKLCLLCDTAVLLKVDAVFRSDMHLTLYFVDFMFYLWLLF